jgi:hypothetical protein
VVARGNERKAIYRDRADRERFLEILAATSRRYGWRRASAQPSVVTSSTFHSTAGTELGLVRDRQRTVSSRFRAQIES